ncbi:hypothetical protein FS837_007321 [Tulasnella sp. UAMH 9824]|nr:hypothetical protein FS837_007321 [Tulasnella sp. UAMH 9824]
MVSRAFLAPLPDKTGGQLVGPSSGDAKSSDRNAKLQGDNGGQEAEGANQEARKEDKEEVEGEEHGSDDETSGRWKAVAVKKMKMKTSDEIVRVLGLTLREAGLLVKLFHENIIKLEGFVEDVSKEIIWLVFPWEDHGNLKDFVASHDWAVPERLSLINILVNSQCRAVITDFGSAHHPATNCLNKERERQMDETRTVPPVEATFCTSTNTITLTGIHYTTRWAAPEVLERDEFSIASDIWALGWVAYEPKITPNPNPTHTKDVAGSVNRSAGLLMEQGQLHIRQSDYLTASKYFTKALGIYTKVGDRKGNADTLSELARIHRLQQEHDQAVLQYTEALEIYSEISDRRGKATTFRSLAEIHLFRDEYDQAVTLYSEALQIFTDIGNIEGRADALKGIADVRRIRNEYSHAIALSSECLKAFFSSLLETPYSTVDRSSRWLRAAVLRTLLDALHPHRSHVPRLEESEVESSTLGLNR